MTDDEITIEAQRKNTQLLQEALAVADDRIDLLLKRIVKTARAVGIANHDAPIDPPLALMLLDDIAECYAKEKTQT